MGRFALFRRLAGSLVLGLAGLAMLCGAAHPALGAPSPTPSPAVVRPRPNPHAVGWSNLLIPGSGEILNGNLQLGVGQAAYEIGSFALGYSLAPRKGVQSLDGIRDEFKAYSSRRRNQQLDIDHQMYSDLLLEFSIKSHMLNTFLAYRNAWRNEGTTEELDQKTWIEGFEEPFRHDNLTDPWVYVPLLGIFAGLAIDYVTYQPDPQGLQPFVPSSSFLYTLSTGIWQPLGSGWPEEAFYRGFLQREFTQLTGSSVAGIAAQSALFALSHESGNGRWSSAAVGLYMGYLAHRGRGNLSKGVTLHFWGNLLLGIETLLISHRDQRTTPPAAMGVQFNY